MSESKTQGVIHRLTSERAADVIEKRTGFELHAWQTEALARLNDDKDVLLTAAPGAGKSTIYLAAAMLMSERHVAIIVCPPEEAGHRVQVAMARKLGLKAASYDCEVVSWRAANHAESAAAFFARVKSREYSVIYISPERLVNSVTWLGLRKAQEKGVYTFVSFVVLEDAHLVSRDSMGEWMPEWTGFRMSFPHAPILAISTSMTAQAQVDAEKRLKLKPDYVRISQPLDRSNVFLAVVKMQGNFQDRCNLDFVFTKMDGQAATKLEEVPQAVIFEDSKTLACETAAHLQVVATDNYSLERTADTEHPEAKSKPFVVAYHAKLLKEEKIELLQRFKAGEIRVLVATEAQGLDLDVVDLQRVISHNSDWSDNKRLKIDALMARINLAGKDGVTPAVALILVPAWRFNAKLDSMSTDIDTMLTGPDGETFAVDPALHDLLNLTSNDCFRAKLLARFQAPDVFKEGRCQNCYLCYLASNKQAELHRFTGHDATEAALAAAATQPLRKPLLSHAELRLVQRELHILRDSTYREKILPSFIAASLPPPPEMPYLIRLETMHDAAEAYTLATMVEELFARIGSEWIERCDVEALKERIDRAVWTFRETWREEKLLLRETQYWA